MLVSELREINPKRGVSYCFTKWAGTIHATQNLYTTRCGYDVEELLTPMDAMDSLKSLCHGCFGK